jgi:raffinose/stachyose/melibiose transport system permease protein
MVTQKSRERASFVGFTFPAFLVFCVIILVPFCFGIYYSFTSWNGIDKVAQWIGIENYRKLFAPGEFMWTTLWFTTRFTFTVVVSSNLLAFLLALVLTKRIITASTLRVVYFIPNVIGGLILGFIWRFIFTQGFPALGKLTGLGFFRLAWLGTPQTGFWGLVIVYVWKTAGYLMVIYIAALMNIDTSIIEAATIDGAPPRTGLARITILLIVPAFTVCLFLMLSWSFKLFDVVFSLTRGAPFGSTETMALNIYNTAFFYNQYGFGSAKAIFFLVLVGIITYSQVVLTKRHEVEL